MDAAQKAYENKYGPGSAPDLSGCSAGPGGSVNLFNCGSNKALAVRTLLDYVRSQHSISCVGPAACGNPLVYIAALGASGGMDPGAGPRGGMMLRPGAGPARGQTGQVTPVSRSDSAHSRRWALSSRDRAAGGPAPGSP